MSPINHNATANNDYSNINLLGNNMSPMNRNASVNNDNNSFNDSQSRFTRYIDANNPNDPPTNIPTLSIGQTQQVDAKCAEWVINRPHIPFTEPTNKYFRSFTRSINPNYQPPNRQRISGTLATNYENKLSTESKQVATNADRQNWGCCYDGTSDRCAEKTVCMIACNPKPIVVAVEPHTKTGEYTAHDHYLAMEGMTDKFKAMNPNGKVSGLMTDCEPTQIAAKREYHEEHPEQFCPGCGIHCLSNHIKNGVFNLFSGFDKDLRSVQSTLKNSKVREGYKEKIVGDQDKRVGLNEPGSTRWGSKDDQIQNMKDTQVIIKEVCNSTKYKAYATDILPIINGMHFWENMSFVGEIVHIARYSIDYVHGIETLGAMYYSFYLVFEFYDEKLDKYIEELGDEYDEDDYANYGYNQELLSWSKNDNEDIEEDEMDDVKNNIITFTKLRNNLSHYWKLCNEDADQCFLVGFMLDTRYVNLKPMGNDKRKFKNRIERLYRTDNANMDEEKLYEELGEIHTMVKNFRKKKGKFSNIWIYYAKVDVYSSYEPTLKFWELVQDEYENDNLIAWICGIALIYCAFIASQGKLEGHFNPLKQFHSDNRGAMGVNKTRKMVYCYNQSRDLARFDSKWKPNAKKKSKNQSDDLQQ
eukprot:525322_1